MLWKAEQDKDGQWEGVLYLHQKYCNWSQQSFILGQFDLGGGVLKVADVMVRSMKLVEVATETPEEPTKTAENELMVSQDPIIQAEEVCADDDRSTSQVQTVDADSMRVTTAHEMLNQMEVASPISPVAPEEFPNDTVPTHVETELPPVEIEATLSPSEQQTDESMEEEAASVTGTTTTTALTHHSQRIENNKRAGIVATVHERE